MLILLKKSQHNHIQVGLQYFLFYQQIPTFHFSQPVQVLLKKSQHCSNGITTFPFLSINPHFPFFSTSASPSEKEPALS